VDTAVVSGAGGLATEPPAADAAAYDGRDDDDDDDDVGWTGIVAAALEQRTANRNALHISAHNDRSLSTCMQQK